MKKLALLALMLFLVPCVRTALGQKPEIRTFSQHVEGVVTGKLTAVVINTDGSKIVDVVKGTARAEARGFPSFADAKQLDDHNIEVSYSFGGLVGAKYSGGVSVQAAVVPGH